MHLFFYMLDGCHIEKIFLFFSFIGIFQAENAEISTKFS